MRQYISNQFPVKVRKPLSKPRISSLWYKDSPMSKERLIMADKDIGLLQKEKQRLSAFGFVLKHFLIHH
jgi:hypothetical protein